MFDIFKRREYPTVPTMPDPAYGPTPAPKEAGVFYSIGRTDVDTLMTLKMGHTTITMTKHFCKDLIAQLELVSNQLADE
jgi:hypothetical protein